MKGKKLGLFLSLLCISFLFLFSLTSCNKHDVHEYGDWEITQEATCDKNGTKIRKCECGEEEKADIPALGHEEVIDAKVEPTCTEKGKTEGKHCSRCNEVLIAQEEIAALGHEEVIDAKVEPTCTEKGKTEGKHCSRCNEVLVAQEEIAALGHEEVIDAKVEPTCTEKGKTEGKHCSRCNEVLVAQEEIAALGHKRKLLPSVTPTCTSSGKTAGEVCSVCDKVLSPQTYLPATGHNYSKVIANNDGTHTKVCSHNSTHTLKENCSGGTATCLSKAVCSLCSKEYGEIAGHTFETAYIITETHHYHKATCSHVDEKSEYEVHIFETSLTAPTCTEKGYTTYTCKCGYSYKDNYVNALGHTYKDILSYNDSNHWYDAICDHSNEKKGLEMHNYTSVVTAPTCTEKGYTTYTCICGHSYIGNYVDELGHNVETWEQVSSTIHNEENCEYKVQYKGVCTVCNNNQQKEELVEKHSLYWQVSEVAHCAHDGTEVQLCANTNCKYHTTPKDSRSYSDLDNHIWDEGVENSTAIIYSCTNCEHKKTVVVSNGDSASVDDLTNVDEVEISGITIGFDSGIKDKVRNANVTIGATTLDGDNKENAIQSSNLSEEQIKLLGDKPIYDFTLNANGVISELGGVATIRIPYELGAGENPNEIIVWYISDGKITPVTSVKYVNGYVEFTTEHFSYYIPSQLTPEQYCEHYGHPENERKVVLATCTTDGYTICLHCGEIFEKTAALGHNWHSEVILNPTCEENGKTKYTCSLCETSYEAIVPATGHYHIVASVEKATCEKTGNTTYKCIYCEDSYQVIIPQLEHVYNIVVKEPTCTTHGYTEKTCTNCGEVITLNIVDSLGHKFDEVWHKAEEGHFHVCTVCGERGDLHEHTPGDAATETTPQICTVCEYIITPQISHKHTLTKVEEVKPTCTTNGNIAYYVCECGKWYSDEKAENIINDHTSVIVLASGHKHENVEAVEPTCTNVGYTAGVYCSECKSYIRGHIERPAYGHTYDAKETAPTCEKVGFTVYTCMCGDTYTEYGTETLDHKYVSNILAPTCTEKGYTTHTCLNCNHSYKDQEVDALGHYEVIDKQVNATCTTSGLTEGKHCDRCGEVLVAQNIIEALGHKEVIDAKVEPTCTEKGKTEGKHCARCSTVLVAQTEIPALGHEEVIDAKVEPTCTEKGKTEGKHCSRCGEVLVAQEEIAALGHEEVIDAKVEPTCTEKGKTEGKHCARCNTVLVAQTEIPALGHQVSKEWTIDELAHYHMCNVCNEKLDYALHTKDYEEATEEHGIKCTVCNYVIAEPLAHTHVIKETVEANAATCLQSGNIKYYVCKCGKIFSDEALTKALNSISDTVVEALGHDKVSHEGKAATCTEKGHKEYVTCSRCDYTTYEELPALGHDYDNGKCTVCGEEQTSPDIFVYALQSGDYYSVTGFSADADIPETIFIPSSYMGKPVKMISYGAFNGNKIIKHVILPNTITAINTQAFANTNIETIQMSKNLVGISREAFANCTSLKEIIIPEGVNRIDANVFNGCDLTIYVEAPCEQFTQGDNWFGGNTIIWKRSITDILEIGNDIEGIITSNDTFVVQGKVVEIINETYGAMYIEDENGNVLYVYKLTGYETLPSVGDTVIIEGNAAKYVSKSDITLELTNGKYLTAVPEGKEVTSIPDFLGIANSLSNSLNTIDEYIIDGIVKEIVNETYGNLYLVDEDGNEIYIYGLYDKTGEIRYDAMENKPVVNQEIRIRGFITKYVKADNSTVIEIKNAKYLGETCLHLDKVEVSRLEPTCMSLGNIKYECPCGRNIAVYRDYIEHKYEEGKCSVCGIEENATKGLEYILNFDGTYSITGFKEGAVIPEEIIIPSMYQGKKVTIIQWKAFKDLANVKSVKLPNTITSIEAYVFQGCTSLTSIEIPEGVTQISTYLLEGCTSLTKVVLPNSILTIDSYAFANCSLLTDLAIPTNVTHIGLRAFYKCNLFENIVIPNTVTYIGGYAFYNCKSDSNIDIPNSIEYIGSKAFKNCNLNCNYYYQPNGWESNWAYGCTVNWLPPIELSIPDALEIGNNISFTITTNDKYIVKGTVKDIVNEKYGSMNIVDENGVLLYVYNLTGYETLPNVGDTVIIKGNAAKYVGKTEVVIELTNGQYLTSVPEGTEVTSIVDFLTIANGLSNSFDSFEIGIINGTVKEVVDMTYGNLYLIDEKGNEIYIYGLYQDGIQYDTLTYKPYAGSNITVQGKITKYITADNKVIIEIKSAELVEFTCEHKNAKLIETVESTCLVNGYKLFECLCGYQYSEMLSLGSCVYENGYCKVCGHEEGTVKGLNYALQGTTYYAITGFSANAEIPETLIIPSSYMGLPVKMIGYGAFKGNTTIKHVILPDTITAINTLAFANTNIESIVLSKNLSGISQRAFENCINLKEIIIPDSITRIDVNVFNGCNLTIYSEAPSTQFTQGGNWNGGNTVIYKKSIEEVLLIGDSIEFLISTNDTYIVQGTVKEIINTAYGAMYVEDASGNILYVYNLSGYETLPNVGDTIIIEGKAAKYIGKDGAVIELTNGAYLTSVPEGKEVTSIANFLSIANSLSNSYDSEEEYIIDGIVKEIANETYGNLYLVDNDGNEIYIYGLYDSTGTIRYDAMENKPVANQEIRIRGYVTKYVKADNTIVIEVKNAKYLGDICMHTKLTETNKVEATCSTEGVINYICSCDKTFSVIIDKTAHTFVDGKCSICSADDPDYGK